MMSSFTVLNVPDPAQVGAAIRAALERKTALRPRHWAIDDEHHLEVAEEGEIDDASEWYVERGGMRLRVLADARLLVHWKSTADYLTIAGPMEHVVPLLESTGVGKYTVTDKGEDAVHQLMYGHMKGADSGPVLFVHGPRYGTLIRNDLWGGRSYPQKVILVTW